ncbi:Uncharacterized protein SAPIO_CDS10632 [Scedosporium apiospermum]|uniref:HD/PDEase domain-containing protein n=1 Tax=Pseudallescheria apiosperma TaxID=563466 RepID=A0A084FU68_PSEDA|nr:Uncharacterized protein SAPIO_CDS10632 [Scedosporium apiospermum]KEZ38630.1 Uncharacterized protein SAPIO_CDS10632 [Scedosporium apiospermum]
MASAGPGIPDSLIPKVTDYVRTYMSNYDGSHDFNHIKRVVHLAKIIQSTESSPENPTDVSVVTLSALLHDVGDKKYLREGENPETMVREVLLRFGADEELGDRVQAICLGVSYSSEVKDPERVKRLIAIYPELAIVQDADRLDAIGAVGIGRTFAFGGAKGRTLGDTLDHFDEKLLLLEGMMKTETGRKLAKERAERLRTFASWWEDETKSVSDI